MLLNELSNKISTNNIWHKTKNKFHDITNKFLGKIKEVKTSPVKLTSFRSIPETPNIATTTKKNSLDFSCQLTAKPTKNSDKYTPEIFFHRLDSLTQTTQKTFPLVDSQYGKTPLERLEAATKKNHDAYIEQRISAKAPPTLSQLQESLKMEKKSNKQKASKQKNERRENPSRIKKFLVRQGITDSLTTKLDLIIDNKTSDTVIQLIQVIAKIKAKKSNVTDSKKIEKYDALLEKAYNALSIFKKNDADVALNGATDLTTKKPSQGSLLTLLDALINKTDVTWAYISKNNESRRIDQGARGKFNRAELTGLLDKQSPVENEQMLKNMEGEFGQRLRSVLDFATEKVGENDVGDSLISKTSKCGTMMVDLIVALRDFLGKEEIEITAPPKITRLIDLKDSETRTLSLIGIERPMLE